VSPWRSRFPELTPDARKKREAEAWVGRIIAHGALDAARATEKELTEVGERLADLVASSRRLGAAAPVTASREATP
jgi:hypothetical protein